ncbi:uncharacterized protein PGTG_13237 [Puccinia graminis f. sp. tritici CRL 75-36-700-3]|uniref:Uncharacterized protein n=1 Tax=Puccinia graminis f. sp. tritici (strain CRL 75-36-700-3 / race SCCL) TaxID=418459 RepID=E3KRD0_PUCGT|nr:uncharacterized protein PGTG_13237 [Puccinia graminis f. sp. tritici CRL 75-36-700-3]EFP86855.1 hypothetical protein PGTG_13237 [Puccinia graminis f. sp. tritici CRL 75-36-700-3]
MQICDAWRCCNGLLAGWRLPTTEDWLGTTALITVLAKVEIMKPIMISKAKTQKDFKKKRSCNTTICEHEFSSNNNTMISSAVYKVNVAQNRQFINLVHELHSMI